MMPKKRSQTGCLYCGAKLSFVSQFKRAKYCSEEHRKLFMQTRDKNGFEELMVRRSRAEAVGSPPEEECAPEPMELVSTRESEPEQVHAELRPAEDQRDGESLEKHYAQFLSLIDNERHYYQELLERLPAAVAVIGTQMQVLYSNRAFRQLQAAEDDVEGLSVTSEEVRDAIRGILGTSREGNTAEGVSLDRMGGRISVVPVPTLSEDGQPSHGAMIFATETTAPVPAAMAAC
jgi:PAS domain-containing protein